MKPFDRQSRSISRTIGAIAGGIALLMALGSLIVAIFVVRPRTHELASLAQANLAASEQALMAIESRSSQLMEEARAMARSTTAIVQALPETLLATQGVLSQSASSLEQTGDTLDQLSKGITGAILPESEELGQNAVSATKAADQLRILSKMIGSLKDSSRVAISSSRDFSARVDRVLGEGPGLRSNLQDLIERVRTLRRLLEPARVSWAAAAIVALFGSNFAFLGILLINLSAAQATLAESEISRRSDVPSSDSTKSRPAA